MGTDNKLTARATFVFGEPLQFFDQFDALETLESPLNANLLTLRANLLSGLRVGTIPYQLVQSGVFSRRFNQLIIAEKIRCRTKVEIGEITEDQIEDTAIRIAKQRMDEEINSPDGIERQATQALAELDHHLSDNGFRTSAQELLRQILIMGWGAFEIFVSDLLKTLINEYPKLITEFAEVKPYRDFLSSRLLMDALQARNFDLSTCMGDIFAEAVKLDSLEKIRDALRIGLGDPSVDILLKDERLWKLSQQRHLIVHRRGIVDRSYFGRTSDRFAVGDYLTVDAAYVEDSLALVRDIGCQLFIVAHEKLRK